MARKRPAFEWPLSPTQQPAGSADAGHTEKFDPVLIQHQLIQAKYMLCNPCSRSGVIASLLIECACTLYINIDHSVGLPQLQHAVRKQLRQTCKNRQLYPELLKQLLITCSSLLLPQPSAWNQRSQSRASDGTALVAVCTLYTYISV